MSVRASRDDGPDGAGQVDPRFDPRFQRGYSGAEPVPPADAAGAESRPPLAPATPADPVRRPDPGSRTERAARASAPLAARPVQVEHAHDDERDPRRGAAPDARPSKPGVWLVVLTVVSLAAVVGGGIGVSMLTSEPPLRLAVIASSASAGRQLAAELVSGPLLTAGLIGVAVALALIVTGPRRVEEQPDAVEDDPARDAPVAAPPRDERTPDDAPESPLPSAPAPVVRIDESAFRPPARRDAPADEDDSRFRP